MQIHSDLDTKMFGQNRFLTEAFNYISIKDLRRQIFSKIPLPRNNLYKKYYRLDRFDKIVLMFIYSGAKMVKK